MYQATESVDIHGINWRDRINRQRRRARYDAFDGPKISNSGSSGSIGMVRGVMAVGMPFVA